MATNKNINETGWFYHAPAKKSKEVTEPVPSPYISQIPGLSEYPEDESSSPQGMYFKDSDTKYVRLSKLGGRKDLLVFKDNAPKKAEEATGYPRVDWYYLQDNAREDADNTETKKPWKFLLPDYMVHEGYVPSCIEGSSPDYTGPPRGRIPYACDKETVYDTDKRVAIKEARQPGFGVRNSKPVKTTTSPTKTKTDHHNIDNGKVTQGDRHAEMHQILAYDYERQWHNKMEKQNSKPSPTKPKGEPPIPSEYFDKYGKVTADQKKNKSVSPTSRRADTVRTTAVTEKDNELFKLSKFKNVPARIDTHQPIATQH